MLLLALLLWRLVERTLRVHVETTGNALTGWDKKATQTPTAFMMRTKFAGVMVIKVEGQRQLVHPLSTVQQQYLVALGSLPHTLQAPRVGNESSMLAVGPNVPQVLSKGERGSAGRSRGRVDKWHPACRGSQTSSGDDVRYGQRARP